MAGNGGIIGPTNITSRGKNTQTIKHQVHQVLLHNQGQD